MECRVEERKVRGWAWDGLVGGDPKGRMEETRDGDEFVLSDLLFGF